MPRQLLFQVKSGQLRKSGYINYKLLFAGPPKRERTEVTYHDCISNTSRISMSSMEWILNQLRTHTKRHSTEQNYLCIWRKFNNFIIKLDVKPMSWEDRISLFGAYLVDNGLQSSSLRSYISAIKTILFEDGYVLDTDKVLLSSLIKACQLINDHVKTRLPIRQKLLEILLFEVQRTYSEQPYLETMYKTIFLLDTTVCFASGNWHQVHIQ